MLEWSSAMTPILSLSGDGKWVHASECARVSTNDVNGTDSCEAKKKSEIGLSISRETFTPINTLDKPTSPALWITIVCVLSVGSFVVKSRRSERFKSLRLIGSKKGDARTSIRGKITATDL